MSWGWNLPPGCRTLPGEEPEVRQPRCQNCQAWLPWQPNDRQTIKAIVGWEALPDHRWGDPILEDVQVGAWRCRRCGQIGLVEDH